jgi:hypothetical protein
MKSGAAIGRPLFGSDFIGIEIAIEFCVSETHAT